MKSKNIPYLPSLDHLRAFAAILIIFYHGFHVITRKQFEFGDWIYSNNPLKTFLIEGHTAVALFMVLSGFIFTYGAIGHNIKYFSFIKNRLLRIYPLFILLIVVGIYTYPNNFTLTAFLQTIFGFSNLPGSLSLGPLSAMFWTISVEFQFYLLFPFIFKFLEKYNIKKLFCIIFVAILFRTVSYLLNSNIRDVSYWSILGRIDQFLVGMIIAKLFHSIKGNLSYQKYLKILLVPSVIILFISLFLFNKLGGWPVSYFWKILWPTFEAIIWSFFILCYISTFISPTNIFSKLLSKIGEMSFSLYLIHMIVIQIICDKNWVISFSSNPFKNSIINVLLIILPITISISFITYNAIEKPFLELRTKYLE